MSHDKRRSSNALPLKTSEAASRLESLRAVKIQADQLREKLTKSVIDNPHTAKKAAMLITLWIEGRKLGKKKAG